jgi:hypothetical protein
MAQRYLAGGIERATCFPLRRRSRAPPSHRDMQPVWDQKAEKLHGISLEQLRANGRPPLEIVRRMNDVLAGRELFSDGPAEDERWLRIIFDEAGPDPAFTIRRLHANILTTQVAAKLGWTSASYETANTEAARIAPRTRRAEDDARHLAVRWQIIAKGPSVSVMSRRGRRRHRADDANPSATK